MGTPQAKRTAPDGTNWKTVVPWIAAAVFVGVGVVLGLREYAYWFCGYGHLAREGWCKSFQVSPPWTLFTALISAPALLLTWYWREKHKREDVAATRDQIAVAQDGQVTERFTRAIEQLGNEQQLAMRLGGIYALERIAKDSPRDHWTIVEALSAFVRISAPHTESEVEQSQAQENVARSPREDIQTALSVLARRNQLPDQENGSINLRKIDIALAKLSEARFEGVILERAVLDGVDLQEANLREAMLIGASLREASLSGANLEGAHLEGANLEGANVANANLAGADFTGAHLDGATFANANLSKANISGATLERTSFKGANLRGAILNGANLEEAYFEEAVLEGTNFKSANLSGANLTTSRGLTLDQLAEAILDHETKLPDDLKDLIPARETPSPDST